MQKNEIISLEITEINNLGAGVGRYVDGRVVFVHGAVTGDTVEARVIKVNQKFLVARLERILNPSPWRLPEGEAFCHAPAACGGCVYRHITYAHELELKQNYVKHAFIKAGLPDVEVEAVRTTWQLCGYRNKAQYPFGRNKNGICIGFYAAKSHTLIPSDACPMQPKLFSAVGAWICRHAERAGWTVYDEESRKGLLRHLYLRYGEGTDQLMVCLVLNGHSLPDARSFIDALTAAFPQTVSVMLNFNTKNTNVVLGEEYRLLYGTPYIEDMLCGKLFRISPQSFYQVNHDGAELLYNIAAERTGMNGQGTLLDLYCGIGSIGLSMAERAERLVGIEIVESAVQCARENAARNGVQNAVFSCGDASDAEKLLDAAERDYGKIDADVVILDPPRKGSTPELITYLCNTRRVPRIVYVSCDPDTLARDCALFRELDYEIGTVTPVDMFPRTGHVESVVCLSREKADDYRKESKMISDERSRYKSWSNLKKHMNDLLCDSLKEKISYFYTSYHEVHNAYGRATINYSKKEMVAFSWVEMYKQEQEVSQLYQEGKKVSYGELKKGKWMPECKLCDADFINSLTIYLKTDIATSLNSDNYLLRVFAYMDRRVGKRTLIKIKDDVEKLPDWVKQFYRIRCEADGIIFPPKRITDESVVCLRRE